MWDLTGKGGRVFNAKLYVRPPQSPSLFSWLQVKHVGAIAGLVTSLPEAAGDGARSAPQSGASVLRQAARGALAGVADSVERCVSAGRSALNMCGAAERTALRASYYAAGAAAGIGLGLCLIARRRS